MVHDTLHIFERKTMFPIIFLMRQYFETSRNSATNPHASLFSTPLESNQHRHLLCNQKDLPWLWFLQRTPCPHPLLPSDTALPPCLTFLQLWARWVTSQNQRQLLGSSANSSTLFQAGILSNCLMNISIKNQEEMKAFHSEVLNFLTPKHLLWFLSNFFLSSSINYLQSQFNSEHVKLSIRPLIKLMWPNYSDLNSIQRKKLHQ